VTEDGTFISLVRLESQDAGRRNKDRPEVDTWWSETAELFTGEPVLTASSNVVVDVAGEPDAAGFVQVIQGRNSDADRARELMADDSPEWARWRPDILGSSVAEHDGGAYTMALYFTSEDAALERESTEPPPELKAVMEEMNALTVGRRSSST